MLLFSKGKPVAHCVSVDCFCTCCLLAAHIRFGCQGEEAKGPTWAQVRFCHTSPGANKQVCSVSVPPKKSGSSLWPPLVQKWNEAAGGGGFTQCVRPPPAVHCAMLKDEKNVYCPGLGKARLEALTIMLSCLWGLVSKSLSWMLWAGMQGRRKISRLRGDRQGRTTIRLRKTSSILVLYSQV